MHTASQLISQKQPFFGILVLYNLRSVVSSNFALILANFDSNLSINTQKIREK